MAEVDGEPVGHVFAIHYGRLGWIGLLIVNPERRGFGIGTSLMQTAVNHLSQVGVETIRLDAEETAAPIYERLGFKQEFDSLRYRKQAIPDQNTLSDLGKCILPMQRNDLEEIARFDSHYFSADRLRVLERLYDDNSASCYVAKEEGKLVGYVMGRETNDGFWIGPCVCEQLSFAERLIGVYIGDVRKRMRYSGSEYLRLT